MKKVLLAFMLLISFGLHSHAQTTPKAKKPPVAPAGAKAVTPAAAKTSAAAPVKKDGTPDMRYKTNKDAKVAPAPAHVKKDGTADKRYKENQKK